MRFVCKLLLAFFVVAINMSGTGQNIRINEIMASNANAMADEDGDFSDWIELYNPGTDAVQLEGWGLTDNAGIPFKWVFPKITIKPKQYLLVWASGKNLKPAEGEWINGVMREFFSNITGTSIQSLIQHWSYPNAPATRQLLKKYFESPVDVANNYGQKVYGYIKAPASGSYNFWLSSDDNGQLWLSPDDTPGNLRVIATVPDWTNTREWNKYAQQKSAQITLEKGKNYYIMALAKEGSGGDNLAVGWQLPDGTSEMPIPAKHLFWPTGELHSNFSISAEGEEIILNNPQGARVDEIPSIAIPGDHSYGRIPDGGQKLGFFQLSTPGKSNTTESFNEILSPPVFSHNGGFYGNPFDLTLSSSQPGVSIVYTIDGSLPLLANLTGTSYQYKNQYRQNPGSSAGPFLYRTFKSNVYNSPIGIRDRTTDANQISGISTTFDSNPWYSPNTPIDKAMVVKARAVKAGALSSAVVSHTYFVKSGGKNPYVLPVISFSTQEDALFDYYKGIYVAGNDFENWRTANPSAKADGGSAANYQREGDEWESPAYMEYFDSAGNRALAQNIGFRLHGNWSNAHPFKSIRVYARSEYGEKFLNYPFFKSQPDNAYKRIILRNSGNDIWYTMFRDAAMQQMVNHMNFETQAYQPSILYINGEYWGVHNIRERYDNYYLARKFGVNEDQLDILENNMGVDEGENTHYAETLNYITRNGVQLESNYDYIKTRLDVSSFMDYYIAQIFIVNTDWPGNNIKYWRLQTPEYLPGAGTGKDGRWRWLLYDADFTFGIYTPTEYAYNMMTFVTKPDGTAWPNPAWSTYLFRKMIENQNFKTEFIVRFTDQLNTAFKPAVVKSIIDRMQRTIEPEMARHIQRWKIPSTLSNWYGNVYAMHTFADQRPIYARSHLRQFFGLLTDYTLTVDVSDKNQGHVVVNTIPLLKSTRGVAENPYPWQGDYFRNVPLRLEAIPAKGFKFVRWESGTVTYTDPVLQLLPGSNLNFTAVFQKLEQTELLVHYWNFNTVETLLSPTFTLLTAGLKAQLLPAGTALITYDTGQNFVAANARLEEGAATHLRVNNPLGASLIFDLPTSGFSNLKFSYETRRSGQGAGTQVVEYSVNGTDFVEIRRVVVKDLNPEIIVIDFGSLVAANNNPNFKIRVSFVQSDGGTAGNNRFDNVALVGIPLGNAVSEVVRTHDNRMDLFPNPFRQDATVRLRLNSAETVNLVVFNMTGKKVREIYHGLQPAGDYSYQIEGNGLVPGTYIVICQTGTGIFRQKLVKF